MSADIDRLYTEGDPSYRVWLQAVCDRAIEKLREATERG